MVVCRHLEDGFGSVGVGHSSEAADSGNELFADALGAHRSVAGDAIMNKMRFSFLFFSFFFLCIVVFFL